jgi:hypothetical protein
MYGKAGVHFFTQVRDACVPALSIIQRRVCCRTVRGPCSSGHCCRNHWRDPADGLCPMSQPKTVTTNWKDLDDIAGGRASGLDGVGAAAAPNVRSGP